MELEELIQELAKLEKDKVVTALKEGAHPVFQEIFNLGHGEATARAKDEKRDLETNLSETQKELEKAQDRVKELEEKTPDVAKVREQYQAEITELKEKHAEELESRDAQIESEREQRAISDLKGALVAGGLDPDYAEVQVQKEKVRKRITHSDDGKLEVLQAGKDIPFQPADGKDPMDLLAGELVEQADPKWKTSNADRGSGSGGGGGNQGGSGFFDQVRENAKKEREQTQPSGPPAAERLGVGGGSGS